MNWQSPPQSVVMDTSDYVFVLLKRETADRVRAFLESEGQSLSTYSYDAILEEWLASVKRGGSDGQA